MSTCRSCGAAKTEPRCRPCLLAGKARYRAVRRAELSAKQRAYHGRTKPDRLNTLRRYYEKNRDVLLPKMRVWDDSHREHKRAVDRAYARANSDKAAVRGRAWRASGRGKALGKASLSKHRAKPGVRAAHTIAVQVRQLLKGQKNAPTAALLGYNREQLRAHLERQFKRGMTWASFGTVWHIDHIIPACTFKMPDEARACWALSNLRPLFKPENLRKGNRREHLI